MASRPFIRIVGAITALWVTIALVEPPGVMICPVHDAPLSVVSPDAHGSHHAVTNHASHSGTAPADAPSRECCACVGECASTATPIALPAAPIVASLVDETPATDLPALPEFAPITRGDVVIPFANGPPSLT